jgi:hypothetical protein
MEWETSEDREWSEIRVVPGIRAEVFWSPPTGTWWAGVNSVYGATDAGSLEEAQAIAMSRLAEQVRKASEAIAGRAGGGGEG